MDTKEMYSAVISGNVAKVDEILSNEPKLIWEIVIDDTWLSLAASENQIGIMELLISRGISINTDWARRAEPAISAAASENAVEAVRWLINHGANVNPDRRSNSPLIGAIGSGSVELVQMLLNAGAITDFTWGHFNYSPLTFAQSFGESHIEIVRLLEKYPSPQVPTYSRERDEVEQYLESCYGSIEYSLCEIISDMPIAINIIRFEGDEPCIILATSGMSAKAMSVPKDADDYKYAELMMYLPPDWPISELASSDSDFNWPVQWLRYIARYPHQHDTWLMLSYTFSNEDPPEPLCNNTKLSCILSLSGEQLTRADNTCIQFYSLYPIYQEERQILEQSGVETLLEMFQQYDISTVVDIGRQNVALL